MERADVNAYLQEQEQQQGRTHAWWASPRTDGGWILNNSDEDTQYSHVNEASILYLQSATGESPNPHQWYDFLLSSASLL